MTTQTTTPLTPATVRPKGTFLAYYVTDDNVDQIADAITAGGFTTATVLVDHDEAFARVLWLSPAGRTHGSLAVPGEIVVDQGPNGVAVFADQEHLDAEFETTSDAFEVAR